MKIIITILKTNPYNKIKKTKNRPSFNHSMRN